MKYFVLGFFAAVIVGFVSSASAEERKVLNNKLAMKAAEASKIGNYKVADGLKVSQLEKIMVDQIADLKMVEINGIINRGATMTIIFGSIKFNAGAKDAQSNGTICSAQVDPESKKIKFNDCQLSSNFSDEVSY